MLAMLCAVMAPATAKAADTQPSVMVTGIPAGEVKIGSTFTADVKVENINLSEWDSLTYVLWGAFGGEDDYGAVSGVIDMTNGTATISTPVTQAPESACEVSVWGIPTGGTDSEFICSREFNLTVAVPKITISLETQGEIYTAQTIEFKVKAENLDAAKTYMISGWGAIVEDVDITGHESTEVTIPAVTDITPGDYTLGATLYEKTGTEGGEYLADSNEIPYTVKSRTELSLTWNQTGDVITGTAYPFSVTVKNVFGEEIENLMVNVNTPGHVAQNGSWTPQVDWQVLGTVRRYNRRGERND